MLLWWSLHWLQLVRLIKSNSIFLPWNGGSLVSRNIWGLYCSLHSLFLTSFCLCSWRGWQTFLLGMEQVWPGTVSTLIERISSTRISLVIMRISRSKHIWWWYLMWYNSLNSPVTSFHNGSLAWATWSTGIFLRGSTLLATTQERSLVVGGILYFYRSHPPEPPPFVAEPWHSFVRFRST